MSIRRYTIVHIAHKNQLGKGVVLNKSFLRFHTCAATASDEASAGGPPKGHGLALKLTEGQVTLATFDFNFVVLLKKFVDISADHVADKSFCWEEFGVQKVDFHKRILFSDEAHFWLNGYVNKQNCRIWSEANPQVYVETPLHPEKLTVWCALWAGGILLQKR
ncbi:hypothetical protein TNCV_2573381 [Trichonephila clavipes]|nr:hypothetical protein TNCV_2573381 [Trichonephila clavipes]